MIYGLLADFVLLLHLAFVLFAAAGGVLVIAWRRGLAWLHVPVVLWAAAIELGGWICPLTPLENALRRQGGDAGYPGGFIEHYVTAWLYPEGLSREVQLMLGAGVLLLNLGIYGAWIAARWRGSDSR
jgi:hypothetical protein